MVSLVVAPLPVAEPVMARPLIARAPRRIPRVVADANSYGVPLHVMWGKVLVYRAHLIRLREQAA